MAALAFTAGTSLVGFFLVVILQGHSSNPLILLGLLILGIVLVLWSAGVLIAGIGLSIAPALRSGLIQLRAANAPRSPKEATGQRKGEAVHPITLLRTVQEAPDRVVLAPVGSPLARAVVLTVGLLFTGVGGLFLPVDLTRASERRRAETIEIPKGGYLPYHNVGLSEWAFPGVFVGLGLILVGGAVWTAWTIRSLIVNPEKRELIRRIALRWPAWTWTRSWPASDIESVYLDEHVTVWPGTPKFLQFLGNVEPRETSEGHVWIQLRKGKAVDCGRGAWEEASELASRLGGLLGAPKTLRERFEVGPPPSNDPSS